jgi:iron(III) transport system permease protein
MMTGAYSKKGDVWKLISVLVLGLYAVILIYPLCRLFKEAVISSDGKFTLDGFKAFFSKSYYVGSIGNSLKVSIATTLISLAIGVPLAYFYQMYEIKGKSLLQVLVILCSMSAPFIGAYAWIVLMGRSGIFTKILGSIGIHVGNIYGFNGILLVLSLQLFPLVFLYVCGALKNIDNSLLEASMNMGCSGAKMFLTVVIPLCMPTIIAASLLVFMRAFADFGTPLLIGEGYETFPVVIYDAYFAETGGNHMFGATVSIIGIVITAGIFLIQNWFSNRHHFTMNALHSIERKQAHGIRNVLINIYCWFVVCLSFMPQVYVIYSSFQKTSGKLFVKGYTLDSYHFAFTHLRKAIPNTFMIGISALVIVIILAILIAYLVVRRSNTANKVIDTLSMIPYIIPGSVIGIALVLSFSRRPILLTGTVAIMVIALIIRRIPYTIRSSVAVLQQIPLTIEEAAISLGSSKMKTFFTVTVPMMGNGIISGAILSWVTIITELSTAVILYNANTVTLTLAVYTYVSRGSYGVAAAYATILTVTTILSLLIYMKVTGNKEVSL